MASITVRDIQKGLKVLGYDPGPVDGTWGTRTQTALASYVNRDLPDDMSINLAGPTGEPGSHKLDLTPNSVAKALKNAAGRYRAPRRGSPSSTAETPAADAALVQASSQSFFRMDNPVMWAIVVLGVGGLGFYGYRKGWFR